MTTGEQLLSLSPLPSGTAAAHLLAITTGAGPGTTVFCTQIAVTARQRQDTVVLHKPQRQVESAPAAPGSPGKTKDDRSKTVFFGRHEIVVVSKDVDL